MYTPVSYVDTSGYSMATTLGGTCASGGFAGSVAAALHFFAAAQCVLQEGWPENSSILDGTTVDFIVVGGGTAGSVVATRLTEVPAFTVLLLEAGGDPPPESVVPLFKDELKNSKYDWNFTSLPAGQTSRVLRGGRQKQPRGKLLGGTGSINDMVYARGFPEDYREWAELLGEEWGWPVVLEYFKKTEHLTDERIVNDPELMRYHSTGGDIHVSGLNHTTPATAALLQAFGERGFPIVSDMTNPHVLGAGRFSHTIRDGQRDGSLPGLLARAAARPNLHVLKEHHVTRVVLRGGRALGVSAVGPDGKEVTFYADREVVVSAGAFNSPKLLQLSGVGPRELLEALGVQPVAELPVGENLQDHVMVPVYLAADAGTCPPRPAPHLDTLRYLQDRSGSLARTDSMGVYYALSDSPDRTVPDFGIYPTCIPAGSRFELGCQRVLGYEEEFCSRLGKINEERELVSLAVVLLKPRSRGRVWAADADPQSAPRIEAGTFSRAEDARGFPEALRAALGVAQAAHFASLRAESATPAVAGCAPADLQCYARAAATSAWHAAGTCALGSVLDARFAVRGVSGLRVVDASAMPTVVRANTNAPVVMLAERAADFIKADHGAADDAVDVE